MQFARCHSFVCKYLLNFIIFLYIYLYFICPSPALFPRVVSRKPGAVKPSITIYTLAGKVISTIPVGCPSHFFTGYIYISTLTLVNVNRNGRGAQYKPLKLLTLKTRKIHLNRPFKVLHSHHLLTDMRYMHWQPTKTLEIDDRIQSEIANLSIFS